MKNLNTFEKGLVVGLIVGIGVTLLLLSLMSEHGPFGKHGPFSSHSGVEDRRFEERHREYEEDDDDKDDENDENDEREGLEEVYFDLRDLVPLGGIIVSIGVLAFGTGFLINTLRKRNAEESFRENEKDKLLRRLELIEEALLEGRIGEETYKELKVKYEEMLNKYKQL
ncbi:MAG TPA: hypothetical protein VHT73_11425 [Thermodesulfobacteriota bacterium]|nr:hypothetical protein [Thermodesulfobacteriota bacterium]